MADALIVVLVVVGCLVAFVAIGDLFDRFFRKQSADQVHRRWRPLSRTDRPAPDVRGESGGFVDDTYGGGSWTDPAFPNGVQDDWHDPLLGDRRRGDEDDPLSG